MTKKSTNELMDALNSSQSIEHYIQSEKEHLIELPLCEYLNQLADKKELKKSQIIHDSELNEIYGYQIFSGKRFPSRDKLISLAFGMHLSLTEAQQLLKYAGFSPLYPKNERDSILIWCLNNNYSIFQTNNALFDHSQNTL